MDKVELLEIATSSVRTKTLEMERKVSCAPNHVDNNRRKTERRNDTDRVVKERRPTKDCGNASRVNDGGTEIDEVEIIEIQDSGSEMDEVEIIDKPTKTLETKRKACYTPKHVDGKRRKAESRNDTDRVEKERRPTKGCGNASQIQDGGSEMDKVVSIELSTKALKPSVKLAVPHVEGKRRKAESRNDLQGEGKATRKIPWNRLAGQRLR
jgi:hypothetical protein